MIHHDFLIYLKARKRLREKRQWEISIAKLGSMRPWRRIWHLILEDLLECPTRMPRETLIERCPKVGQVTCH